MFDSGPVLPDYSIPFCDPPPYDNINKVKIRVKTKYGAKKLPHYEDTILKPHPVYTNIEGNKCGILRYIGGKEIGDSTKRKISFKFNGKKFTKTGQNWFGNVIGVNRLNEAGYIYLITIHTKILMSKKLTK